MAVVGELMEVILYVQDMNAQVAFYTARGHFLRFCRRLEIGG